MTPPTPEELLRLARKVYADELAETCAMSENYRDGSCDVRLWDRGDKLLALISRHERSREALHAALLVLSGELDVAALLAERDFYRNEVVLYESAASFCPPQDGKEDP